MMENDSKMDDFNNQERQVMVQREQTHLPSTLVRETMPTVEEEEIHLRDYIDVIIRRKWAVIITLIVTFATVALFTFSTTPLFLARGMIKASPTAKNVTSFQSMDDSYMKSQEYISTQIRLLQSESLLKNLITTMDLNNDPVFSGSGKEESSGGFFAAIKGAIRTLKSAVISLIRPQSDSAMSAALNDDLADQITLDRNLRKIKSSLRVSAVRDTQLIEVSMESESSPLSSDMVNTLMELFLQTQVQSQLKTMQSAEIFLDKQIESAKIQLEKSEKQLNQYAKQTGIISLDSKLNLTMRQLEEVNDALVKAVTIRIGKESLYRQLEKDGGENLPEVLNNSLMQELKKEYSQRLSDYEKLTAIFKDEYPKVKKIKAQLLELQKRYNIEQQRVVDSIRIEYEAALDNEQRLRKLAESHKQMAMELNDKATQFKILEREVLSNKEVYNSLLTRSKEIEASVGANAGQIEIIDMARAPLHPYKPKVRRMLLLGIILGIFGGIGLAFALEYMDNTVKNPDEFVQRYRLPVLGLIPFIDYDKENEFALAFKSYDDPKSPLSEAVRTSLVSIALSSTEAPPKTILITSVLPNAGKSTLASNFSLSLLPSNAKVLLIDTDLRKPTLHKIYTGCNNKIGLSTYLTGSTKANDLLQETEYDNLFFIPSGPIPPNPAELLASSRMRNLIAETAKNFDYVIIDAPPFQGFAEILILSNMVDGVILAAELNRTPRDGVQYFKKAVTNVGGRIIGVLINKAPKAGHGYNYYGGYSYYKYNYEYGQNA